MTEDWRFYSRKGQNIFLSSAASRQALEPMQFRIQLESKAFSKRLEQPGLKLTNQLHLKPRLGMYETIPPLTLTLI